MSELSFDSAYKKNGLSLFLALVGGQIAPEKRWRSLSWRSKFLLRSLATPVSSWQHMQHIASLAPMQNIIAVQPTLPDKIHRPYLHLGLSVEQRVAALHYHYQFVDALQNSDLRRGMFSPSPFKLVSFTGKNGENLCIELRCNGRCDREGEVNLIMACEGVIVGLMTFAITEKEGQPQLIIGGLQGACRDTPHDFIRHTTKICHGLFPKRLLLDVMLLLANAMGIKRICAVRDTGHVFYSIRYRFKKKALFHACYDEFWESVSGNPESRHLYTLPLTLPRKPLEEIASKKRAEYRRRYELIDQIQQQFSSRFH